MRCLRCDWRSDPDQPDGRAQLTEHADTAGHPICLVCRQSLKTEEPRVCEPCLTESRSLLAGIALMTDELPRHLGQLRGTGYDQTSRSSEKPLIGGDALVLAGPGSGGTGARVLTRHELERGLVQGLDGREHHVDNRDIQAFSVEQVLTQWEDDWRHLRGEPAAYAAMRVERVEWWVADGVGPLPLGQWRWKIQRGGKAAAVRAALGYLEVQGRWAANEHPDFDGYLDDLRILHGRMERATGRDERPVRADASCFECSGVLLRLRKDGQPCHHTDPPPYPSQYEVDPTTGRLRMVTVAADVRAQHARELDAWTKAHGECQQGGFLDKWVCGRCSREYEWGRYLLALRGRLEESASGWSLPEHVAHVLGVPLATVRSWAQRGMVATACLVTDRRLRVSYEEVADRVRRRRERAAKAEQLVERDAS